MISEQPSEYTVIAGRIDLNLDGAIHDVVQFYVHPYYDSANQFLNDIALVRVSFVSSPEEKQTLNIYSGPCANLGCHPFHFLRRRPARCPAHSEPGFRDWNHRHSNWMGIF